MIHLITGQPGAGKTLYALWSMLALTKAEPHRPVFYSGISDLKVDGWQEVEADKWQDCPEGSIIVIDECQRAFRPRGAGQQVPEHVSALETHRHRGIDLVLITQHPMLADQNVRRLAGRHSHVMRNFGLQRATVHEWAEVKVNPDQNRSGSVRREWAYPKEVYALYKSAELHTVKRRVPMRFWFLLLSPLLIGAVAWYAWQGIAKFGRAADQASSPLVVQGKGLQPAVQGVRADSAVGVRKSPAVATADWFTARMPRVEGLAHTAPAYDQVTAPIEAPIPVACIASAKRCECWSQQATRMQMPESMCRQIVANGYFVDWQVVSREVRERRSDLSAAEAPAERSVKVAASGD
ncbi:MAG: zonular occludens toxin [Burkholderiales bacterium]|nr:zonular occludens toxin [Burkholderiales bacterium]